MTLDQILRLGTLLTLGFAVCSTLAAAETTEALSEVTCNSDAADLLDETHHRCLEPRSAQCRQWLDHLKNCAEIPSDGIRATIVCAQMMIASEAKGNHSEPSQRLVVKHFQESLAEHDNDARVLDRLALCRPPDPIPIRRRVAQLRPNDQLNLILLSRQLVARPDRASQLEAAGLYERIYDLEFKRTTERGLPPSDTSWARWAVRIYESLGEEERRVALVRLVRARLKSFHGTARNPRSDAEAMASAMRRVCYTAALEVVGASDCIGTLRIAIAAAETDADNRRDLVKLDAIGNALNDLYILHASDAGWKEARKHAAPEFLEKVESFLASGADLTSLRLVRGEIRRELAPE